MKEIECSLLINAEIDRVFHARIEFEQVRWNTQEGLPQWRPRWVFDPVGASKRFAYVLETQLGS